MTPPGGFEYRSAATLFGLPLLHVAYGRDPITGTRRVARGVIAVGQAAFGVVAIGQLAVGLVAIGQLSVGLFFALGQLAGAVVALGQFATGVTTAVGQFASALSASGQVTVCVAEDAWHGAVGWFGGGGHTWHGVPGCFGGGSLGTGAGLALVPILLVWGLAAAALAAATVHGGRRARRARAIPRGPAATVHTIAAGPVKLAGRVAPDQGTVFRASAPYAGVRPAAVDFLVAGEDDASEERVRVLARDAEFFVSADGDEASLRAGDPVVVAGVAERHPDSTGEARGYREAPTRWTVGGEVAVVGRQDAAVVRAGARLVPALARLFAASAVVVAAWALLAALN